MIPAVRFVGGGGVNEICGETSADLSSGSKWSRHRSHGTAASIAPQLELKRQNEPIRCDGLRTMFGHVTAYYIIGTTTLGAFDAGLLYPTQLIHQPGTHVASHGLI